MQRLADSTGGNTFVPEVDADLAGVFSRIAAELRGQYLLRYYASSEAPATQFRRIRVTVPTRADLKIRARQGFYLRNSKTLLELREDLRFTSSRVTHPSAD